MLQVGLLWFDDDAKRPLAQKVADAVARYGERLGGVPTVCQLNPAAATLLAAQRQTQRERAKRERVKAAKAGRGRGVSARVPRLPRLVPDPSLPSNYFFVGNDEAQSGAVEQAVLAPPAVPAVPAQPVRAKRAAPASAAAASAPDAASSTTRPHPAHFSSRYAPQFEQ